MSNIGDRVYFDEKNKHCGHRYAEHHQEVLFDLEAGFSRAFEASQSTWAHHHLNVRFRSEPLMVSELCRHLPTINRTLGNILHIRGAVATSKSIPFRYASRESTTMVTAGTLVGILSLWSVITITHLCPFVVGLEKGGTSQQPKHLGSRRQIEEGCVPAEPYSPV